MICVRVGGTSYSNEGCVESCCRLFIQIQVADTAVTDSSLLSFRIVTSTVLSSCGGERDLVESSDPLMSDGASTTLLSTTC